MVKRICLRNRSRMPCVFFFFKEIAVHQDVGKNVDMLMKYYMIKGSKFKHENPNTCATVEVPPPKRFKY